MTSITNAYHNALLADATYALGADTSPNTTGTDLEPLVKVRMTPTLAKYIGDNFTAVAQINAHIVGSKAWGNWFVQMGALVQGRILLVKHAFGGSFGQLVVDSGETTKCIQGYKSNSRSCVFNLRKRQKIYKQCSRLVASTWSHP